MRNTFHGFAAVFVLALGLTACGGNSGPPVSHVDPGHQVSVNHDLSIEKKIALGGYDWVNDNIANLRFTPSERTGTEAETMALFSFNQSVFSETAVQEMAKHRQDAPKGYHPATLDECLAFGATISDTHSNQWIICLGSSAVVGGYRLVPVLGVDDGGWGLGLGWWGGGWLSSGRFLAVRN